MDTKRALQIAGEEMKKGRNCCQAALLAAKEVWDIPVDENILAATAFMGGGMGAGCLPELLDSLQRFPDIEIIISDGGSSDRSLEICSRYPVKIVTGSSGRGMQLNRGAQLATAPIFLFLHADSWLEPIVVEQVLEAIKEGYHWGCATMDFDKRTPFYRVLAFFSNLRARCWKSCYGDQAIWCRQDVFFNNGGFPDTPLMEDLALSHHLRSKYRCRVVSGRVASRYCGLPVSGPKYISLSWHFWTETGIWIDGKTYYFSWLREKLIRD